MSEIQEGNQCKKERVEIMAVCQSNRQISSERKSNPADLIENCECRTQTQGKMAIELSQMNIYSF